MQEALRATTIINEDIEDIGVVISYIVYICSIAISFTACKRFTISRCLLP